MNAITLAVSSIACIISIVSIVIHVKGRPYKIDIEHGRLVLFFLYSSIFTIFALSGFVKLSGALLLLASVTHGWIPIK